MQQFFFTLLAVVCVFSTSGCRDFEDSRTPYKPFVTVAFHATSGKDDLDITAITNIATGEVLTLSANKDVQLPLNPHTDVVQFAISRSSVTATAGLIIHYQRGGVLVSHRCGGAQKYVLKKVVPTFIWEYAILNKELSMLNDSSVDVQIYL